MLSLSASRRVCVDFFRVVGTQHRPYNSRAHPKQIPELSVPQAVNTILDDIERRRRLREQKWERSEAHRKAKGKEDETLSSPDETIEFAINLNVDPRKPGQSLRGSISLPNGSGKKVNCVVFTTDTELQEEAKKVGALHAGGESLVDQLVSGEVPVDSFQRSLATNDIMPILTKKAARLLGPRGLMPNVKVGSLVPPDQLINSLKTQIAGKDVQYRTEKEGIVHVAVGKGSFGPDKLIENIGAVAKEIFAVKPENYGKGKKAGKPTGKGTKYLLRASISSTQGKGIRLDPRTVDPTSTYFLTSSESITEEKRQVITDKDPSNDSA